MERLQCPWKNGLILLLIWLKWPRKAEGFQYLLRPTYKKLQQWDFWTASVAFPNQGWGHRSQAVCSPTRSSWRYSVLTLYFSYGSDFGLGIEEGTTLYVLCYSLGSINPLPGTLHLVPIGNNLRWTDVFHFWFFHSFLNVSWRVLKKKKKQIAVSLSEASRLTKFSNLSLKSIRPQEHLRKLVVRELHLQLGDFHCLSNVGLGNLPVELSSCFSLYS